MIGAAPLPLRRRLFLALPRYALTAACAFGVALVWTSPRPGATPACDTGLASQPLDADATPVLDAASLRVGPLPVPAEDDRT